MEVCHLTKLEKIYKEITARIKKPNKSFTIMAQLKRHVREVESYTKTKKSYKLKKQGYCTQGGD